MILVDSTVWIDYFNGQSTFEADLLDQLLSRQEILVGDIILAEVLQGFRRDEDFEAARQALARLTQVSLCNPTLAIHSASNYRRLRKSGVTIRKTLDCFIATFCLDNHVPLLHSDQDFTPFEKFLGLQVVHP
jgi:predicted nucleic acid-binding protein